jgi:hypothetical protein
MAAHTLADVGSRALEDVKFWRELRANPAEALRRAGFSLEPEDLRALEEAVSGNRLVIDLNAFMEGFHGAPGPARWIGRWIAGWPGRWPPPPFSAS